MRLPIKSRTITIVLHVLIWSAVLALPLFLGSDEHVKFPGAFPASFFVVANILHLGLFYLNAFYLYPKFMNRRWWWLYIVLAFLLITGIFRLKFLILNIGYPEVAHSRFLVGYLGFPNMFFFIISVIYRIILNRIQYEKRMKEREAQQLSTELKFLRSQISPHFLFNVINNMVSLARQKSDRLEPSLIRLAELMRYMLYESDGKKVLLSKEIDYLKSYIELQKIRFEEDVEITADMQYDDAPASIEPMLLIPFVENAFKHGTALVEQPFIHIELRVKDQKLTFLVANKFSMETAQSKDKDSGIGLANVKTRLQLLYPGQHVLTIDNQHEVFRTKLTLPLS